MEEDSEYKGDYMGGDLPWVWVVWAIYWKRKSCGLTQGRQAPLAGYRAMWTNRRAVRSLDSPLQEHVLRACSQVRVKRTDWDHTCGFPFSPQLPTPTHALLTLRGCSALEQGLPWWGRELGCGKRRCIWPRAASEWNSWGHALEGTYTGSPSGDVLISDGGQTAAADDPVCAQSPWGPHLPNRNPLQHGRAAESGETDQLWGTKGSQTRSYV